MDITSAPGLPQIVLNVRDDVLRAIESIRDHEVSHKALGRKRGALSKMLGKPATEASVAVPGLVRESQKGGHGVRVVHRCDLRRGPT